MVQPHMGVVDDAIRGALRRGQPDGAGAVTEQTNVRNREAQEAAEKLADLRVGLHQRHRAGVRAQGP